MKKILLYSIIIVGFTIYFWIDKELPFTRKEKGYDKQSQYSLEKLTFESMLYDFSGLKTKCVDNDLFSCLALATFDDNQNNTNDKNKAEEAKIMGKNKIIDSCRNGKKEACIISKLLDTQNIDEIVKLTSQLSFESIDNLIVFFGIILHEHKLNQMQNEIIIQKFTSILVDLSNKNLSNKNLSAKNSYLYGILLLYFNKDNTTTYFQKACKKNARFCSADFNTEDLSNEQQKKYYTIFCNMGNSYACNRLALLYEKSKIGQDVVQAVDLYTKACNDGDAWACYNLAVSYEDGQIVRHDKQRAIELYGKSCDLGLVYGCNRYQYIDKTWLDKLWYLFYAPYSIAIQQFLDVLKIYKSD